MENTSDKPTVSNIDKVMIVIGITSLLAFPIICIEQIWFDILPTMKLMVTDIILFLVSSFYWKVQLDMEKRGKETKS